MVRRILYATLVMGGGGFVAFAALLHWGLAEAGARNLLLLLFVLFENFQTLNSRSERHSVFAQSLTSNPLLIGSIVGAQLLHIAATYVPWLADTLDLKPFGFLEWSLLVLAACPILVVSEIDKYAANRNA